MTPDQEGLRSKQATPRPEVGKPFNPWYKICGFHPPEVRRCTDPNQGPKLLYQRCMHWAGQKATFWYGFDAEARELGYSIRQVQRDMLTLKERV